MSDDALKRLRMVLHPIRYEILRAVEEHGQRSPVQFSQNGSKVENVAYHFRVLRDAELLCVAKETQTRGAIEHHYRLTEAGQKALAWVGLYIAAEESPRHRRRPAP
jgi:DNA-binding transcriptional ArsR family regulator